MHTKQGGAGMSCYYCSYPHTSAFSQALQAPASPPKNRPCGKNYKQQHETYLQADEKQMLEASRKGSPGTLVSSFRGRALLWPEVKPQLRDARGGCLWKLTYSTNL